MAVSTKDGATHAAHRPWLRTPIGVPGFDSTRSGLMHGIQRGLQFRCVLVGQKSPQDGAARAFQFGVAKTLQTGWFHAV